MTTHDLVEALRKVDPAGQTRVFTTTWVGDQALVQELQDVEVETLRSGGRRVVLSFEEGEKL